MGPAPQAASTAELNSTNSAVASSESRRSVTNRSSRAERSTRIICRTGGALPSQPSDGRDARPEFEHHPAGIPAQRDRRATGRRPGGHRSGAARHDTVGNAESYSLINAEPDSLIGDHAGPDRPEQRSDDRGCHALSDEAADSAFLGSDPLPDFAAGHAVERSNAPRDDAITLGSTPIRGPCSGALERSPYWVGALGNPFAIGANRAQRAEGSTLGGPLRALGSQCGTTGFKRKLQTYGRSPDPGPRRRAQTGRRCLLIARAAVTR